MNKLLLVVIGAVALVALCFGVLGYLASHQGPPLGAAGIGTNHYLAENFLQGLYGGTLGQFFVKNTGAVSSSAAFSVSGAATLATTHVGSFAEGGAALSLTTTSTLTGTQLCTSNPITVANTTSTVTLTLPVATDTNTVANCLTTDGDFFRLLVLDNGTNTVKFATSTGDTYSPLMTNATNTVPAFQLSNSTGTTANAILTVLRVNSSTDQYFVQTYNNGL